MSDLEKLAREWHHSSRRFPLKGRPQSEIVASLTALLSRVTREALEEAARVAENHEDHLIARAIRALAEAAPIMKEKP